MELWADVQGLGLVKVAAVQAKTCEIEFKYPDLSTTGLRVGQRVRSRPSADN
jgi:hypothetical protein